MGSDLAEAGKAIGVGWVGLGAFGLLVMLIIADLFLTRGKSYIGYWALAWSRRYPLFALAIAVVLGALVGHFYWSTRPPCDPPTAGAIVPVNEKDCVKPSP